MKKIIKICISVLIGLTILSGRATMLAAENSITTKECHYTENIDFPEEVTNWHKESSVNYFDPTAGTLTAIELEHEANITLTQKGENLSEQNSEFKSEVDTVSTFSILGHESKIYFSNDFGPITLAAYDSVIDFGGESGFTDGPTSFSKNDNAIIITDPTELANFLNSGVGGVSATASAEMSFLATGPSQLRYSSSGTVSSSIAVTYRYTAHTCIGEEPENTPPTIELIDANPITITKGHTFSDPGATANDFEDGDLTQEIVVTGTVDINTVGAYPLTYSVTDSGGLSASITRQVIVIAEDSLCPETGELTYAEFLIAKSSGLISFDVTTDIDTFLATATITNNSGCTFPASLSVYRMFDDVLSHQKYFDGTDVIQIGPADVLTANLPNCTAQIDFWFGEAPHSLLDSNPYSGPNPPVVLAWAFTMPNKFCTDISNTPPTIELVGAGLINILVGSSYTEQGAIAQDAEDGNHSAIVGGDVVDVNTPGTYTITYNYTDTGGLKATEIARTVVVFSLPPQCSDDEDNDKDGVSDGNDPGCHSDGNANNQNSYISKDNDENALPAIELIGSSTIDLIEGDTYTEKGAIAHDYEDGNNPAIIGGDKVDVNTLGTYVVTYSYTDKGGAKASEIIRTIKISQKERSSTHRGSSGGRRIIRETVITPTPQVLGASTSCGLYLDKYLQKGRNNNPEAVKKLQLFLNGQFKEANLVVDGIFGIQTDKYVRIFQEKHADKILKPWGLSSATGIVYLTTQTEINNIMCPPLNLPIPELVPLELNPAFPTLI